MSERSLYHELGGQKAIKAVVDEFYRRMLEDEMVNKVFKGVDMDRLRDHQAAFLAYALGGPAEYDGRTLREAHKGYGISFVQYERAIKHLKETLASFDVPVDAQIKVEALLRSVKPFVVER